ncbi:hypothetical protein BGW38_007325, partial [Lunasporangiospora selenospora]
TSRPVGQSNSFRVLSHRQNTVVDTNLHINGNGHRAGSSNGIGGSSSTSSSSSSNVSISEPMAVQSNSSSSTASPSSMTAQGLHGFELSYWQKFALNELFMRCFNVMHDMPDTALESVLWMDVSSKDVVLLITMIDLRDIMVDDRYWKRGFWTINRPNRTRMINGKDKAVENHPMEDEDDYDWEGFYFLINQEGLDKRSQYSDYPSFPYASSDNRTKLLTTSSASSSIIAGSAASGSSSAWDTRVSGSGSYSGVGSDGVIRSSASSINGDYYSGYSRTRKLSRSLPRPAPWQGFGDEVSDDGLVTAQTDSSQPQLHPALELFEMLKPDIDEASAASRVLGKGRMTESCLYDGWVLPTTAR